MLGAFRKHTKIIFWAIIIILVPAFAVLYVPRALQPTGERARQGTVFGQGVTRGTFRQALTAEVGAANDFSIALETFAYRKPQYDFLRVRRELALAAIAQHEAMLRQRERLYALLYTGERPRPVEIVSVEVARESLKARFTDPETGEYDEAAYAERRRALGMTDEEYLAEFRDNLKVLWAEVWPLLRAEDQAVRWQYQRRATWRRLILAHEARRLGIPVSDEDVRNYLYLLFPGDDGTIDQERYTARLRASELDRGAFEREVRTTIRIATLQRMVLNAVKAPAQDVTERFDQRYTTYTIAYHFEPYEALMEPDTLRDDEVLDFYMTSRGWLEDYHIAPKVAVMYVLVETKSAYPKVEVPDETLTAYYEAHTEAFAAEDGTPRPYEECADEVRAAVIEADRDLLREADKLARADASRMFSVATPVRLIQQAARCGYEVHHTPLFDEEGEIDGNIAADEEAFREAVFEPRPGTVSRMAPGDVSGPIKVKQGWCVLSPTYTAPDIETRHRPLDEALAVARTELARERARRVAHELAAGLFEEVEEVMTGEEIGFLDACSKLHIGVTQAGPFDAQAEELPGLEDAARVIFRASKAEEMLADGFRQPKDVYLVLLEQGSVFFNVLDTQGPDAHARAEQGPPFTEQVLRSLRGESYAEWFQELEARAAVDDYAEALRQEALKARADLEDVE